MPGRRFKADYNTWGPSGIGQLREISESSFHFEADGCAL